MSSKQTRPHSPAGTRLRGPDRDGNYEIMIPSERAPGVWHTLDVAYTGDALGCTCPGYRRYLDYLASLRTATPLPARRPCWHVEGAADLLAHHRDRPPADPGGAARPDPGFATPLDPDDEGPFAGGAALDRAQAAADGEINDWILGSKLSPPPWLVAPGERRQRHDDGMADLYGPDWRTA
jgi:hypothetical protein